MARRLGKTLDPLLDVSERCKTGFDRGGRDVLQHVGCNGIAQTVEIVDQLAAARREEQPVGAAVLGIVPALKQTVLDQTVKKTDQRDRLQFENVGEIDLGNPSCCRNRNSTIHCARVVPRPLARWSIKLRNRRELSTSCATSWRLRSRDICIFPSQSFPIV